MRWLAALAAFLLVSLLPLRALADQQVDEAYLKFGVGVFHSADYGKAETKTFAFGEQNEFWGPFYQQKEVGLWVDPHPEAGRTGSGYGAYSLGVESNPGYLVAKGSWGVAVITSPDSMLGGPFQFKGDVYLGVRDDRGKGFGLDYEHISSAGIYNPNMGRDMLTVRVSWPW